MKRFTLKRNNKSKYNSKKSKSLNVNRAKKGGGGNINIGKTRELYFGARQIDEDHTHRFVIQKESKKGNIETDYQDCKCPIEDYGKNCAKDSDDCNEINLNCECSTKKSSKKKIVQEAWNPNYNDPEDSDSDSDDENVEFTETSGYSYSPEESEDSLREELDDLKKELNRVEGELQACYQTGRNNKECLDLDNESESISKRKKELELELESTRGGGSKHTKKSKLSKLKSLIKDYERVIKKYRNKIIKFNSTTKDKSSKKSTKDSKDKSSNKSKKLSVKKSKSKSKTKSKAT